MSETRDDLREALARIIEPAAFIEGTPNRQQREGGFLSPGQRSALRKADACIAGPFAPILAQVSALQAEVERLQKVEGERGRLERDPKGSGCRPDGSSPQAVSPPRSASIPRAWVVTNGEADDLRYRMWSGRAWVWTPSLAQAAHFARIQDARQILADGDEHGQRVVLLGNNQSITHAEV